MIGNYKLILHHSISEQARNFLLIPSQLILPRIREKNSSLFISTDANPDYMCICPYLSSLKGNSLVMNLGVKIIGPAVVHLALVDHYDKADNEDTDQGFHCVNVFGHVQYVSPDIQQLVDNAKTAVMVDNEVDNEVDDVEDGSDEIVDTMQKVSKAKENAKKSPKETVPINKRKLSNLDEPMEDADRKIAKISSEPSILSKKQRKQLAKKKEQELHDVIAKENDHASKASNKADANKKHKSLTRPRMIKGGILIQDIIHGNGSSCKTGRKVSINYVGTFLDGKVFDKNQSKGKPLTFRLGTGEVIKGLDRGLEGMKVNGERIITIPSEMGYGSKGSGNIPGDTKLCFSVHVKSVGSK
mmetsp:Transcript_11472/g.16722  ORF Transcript_11472/g.16722 Transcript_11472/m.16722 type:complete len:357 (+) Transcript_11472:430-1500(+)